MLSYSLISFIKKSIQDTPKLPMQKELDKYSEPIEVFASGVSINSSANSEYYNESASLEEDIALQYESLGNVSYANAVNSAVSSYKESREKLGKSQSSIILPFLLKTIFRPTTGIILYAVKTALWATIPISKSVVKKLGYGLMRFFSGLIKYVKGLLRSYRAIAAGAKAFFQMLMYVGRLLFTTPQGLAVLGIIGVTSAVIYTLRKKSYKETDFSKTGRLIEQPIQEQTQQTVVDESIEYSPTEYESPSGKIIDIRGIKLDSETKKIVIDAIQKASDITGVSSDLLIRIASIETGNTFNPNAVSPTGASGLFQFTRDTWYDTTRAYGKKYNITPQTSRFDPYANALMAAERFKNYINNINKAKDIDISPDDPNASVYMYIAHNLGEAGARRYIRELKKRPNAVVTDNAVDINSARKNPLFFYPYDSTTKTRDFSKPYSVKKSFSAYQHHVLGNRSYSVVYEDKIPFSVTVAKTKAVKPSVNYSADTTYGTDKNYYTVGRGVPVG